MLPPQRRKGQPCCEIGCASHLMSAGPQQLLLKSCAVGARLVHWPADCHTAAAAALPTAGSAACVVEMATAAALLTLLCELRKHRLP